MSAQIEQGSTEIEVAETPVSSGSEFEKFEQIYKCDFASNADSINVAINTHNLLKLDLSSCNHFSISKGYGFRLNTYPIICLPKAWEFDDNILLQLNDTFFGKCIRADFADGVKFLLSKYGDKGLDITTKSKSGMSPFRRAVIGDNDDIVNALLKKDKSLVEEYTTESLIHAVMRRPSVNSLLKNSTFSGGDDQERALDAWYRGDFDDTTPIALTYYGPISRINDLVERGAKVSRTNSKGVTPLQMAQNPEKYLKDLVPKGEGDNFIVRTSPFTVKEGVFQYTAKIYNQRRSKFREITITHDLKSRLAPVLSELALQERNGLTATKTLSAKMDAMSDADKERFMELRTKVLNDFKDAKEEFKTQSEELTTRLEQLEVDQSNLETSIDTAVELARDAKAASERLEVSMMALQAQAKTSLNQLEQMLNVSNQLSNDIKELKDLTETQRQIKTGMQYFKRSPNPHLYEFFHNTAVEMNSIMFSTLVGIGTKEKEYDSKKIVASMGHALASHISIPGISGLINMAAKGLEAYSDYKRRKRNEAVSKVTPINPIEFSTVLAIKLAKNFEVDLTNVTTPETDKLAKLVTLLAYACMATMGASHTKFDPEEPNFADILIKNMINNPDKDFQSYYKAFSNELAKIKSRAPVRFTPGYTAQQQANKETPQVAVVATTSTAKKPSLTPPTRPIGMKPTLAVFSKAG